MMFRLGLVSGFAAGYYLGSMAGRERYQQIQQVIRKVQGSPAYDQATDKAREYADVATEKAKDVAEDVAEKAKETGTKVKAKTSKNGKAEYEEGVEEFSPS